MDKRLILLTLLLLGFIGTAAFGDLTSGLVAHWAFDEESGATAADSSGNGHDGTLNLSPQWVEGLYGGALDFRHANTNECVVVPAFEVTGGGITLAAWLKPRSFAQADARIIDKGTDVAAANDAWWMLSPVSSGGQIRLRFRLRTDENATTTTQIATSGTLVAGEWHHAAAVWDGTSMILYQDAVETGRVAKGGTAVATNPSALVYIGNQLGGTQRRPFDGLIDDACVFSRGLSVEEIQELMAGLSRETASGPSPDDGAQDTPRDIVLSWTAGEFAAGHDVYFGTEPADVDAADRANPRGVLAGSGQTATTFDPDGLLEYGQTYYWRIDEVAAPPDNTIFKGPVWSFTVEPYGYPVTNLTATASGAAPGMGPERTIDGSGLNVEDEHSIESTQMWLSAGSLPSWIQYEFDGVYKLHELWVWNSNQMIEPFTGFGARNVTIEYSTDGAAWTTLEDVPEFARASGAPTYLANTVIDFNGAMAKFVRLTIESNWGGVAPQTGLSEVRFFSIPVQAREPQPADGATGVSVDTGLNWRPGREATSHVVYFGTNEAAVADGAVPGEAVTEHSYTPASLNFGTTYFWKVDEVGDTGTYPGDVWSFTTQEYAVVEDFESYNDDDNRIYDTWIDGLTDPAKGGSQVGYDVSPFAERTIVHGGKQSMPFMYDNAGTPFYSETQRTFDSPQDWTVRGIDALRLHVHGRAAPGSVSFDSAAQVYTMTGAGSNIWGQSDEFHFAFKQLNGDGSITVRLDGMSANPPHGDPRIGVMIRETLDPDAANATLFVEPDPRTRLTQRVRVAADTTDVAIANLGATPTWLRLTRQGFLFKAEKSDNGTTWTPLLDAGSEASIAMTDPVFIGLVVCSHAAGQSIEATFSNVKTTGQVTPAGAFTTSQDVGIASNSPQPLYVTLQDSANHAATVANPDLVNTVAWTAWDIPLADFAGVNPAAVQRVTIGVGDPQSPTSDGAGIVFIDDIRITGSGATDDGGNTDLAAYYSFEDSVQDASGNGLHGTTLGNPSYADGPAGYGKAMNFDGTDDVVELGNFDVVGGGITLAAWINPRSFQINDGRIISKAKEWGANDHWWMLSTVASGGSFVPRFRLKTNESDTVPTLIGGANGVLATGEWSHVTAAWDGESMLLYVDGAEVGRMAKGGSAVAVDPTVGAAIGSQPPQAFATDPSHVVKFFDGLIDEVRIYNRALAEPEIRDLAGSQ